MPMAIYSVVLTGLVGTIVALVLALREGRTDPVRRVPWIIALVALGVDSALHLAISVGSLVAGGWGSMWIVIGSVAIAGVFVTAWLSPRLAGWWLVITALLLPVILIVANGFAPPANEQSVPVSVLLAFYTPRMLIVGGLLIWSAGSVRRTYPTAPAESDSSATTR